MNPCIDCSLDKLGCHESGFADAKCKLWQTWRQEIKAFIAQYKKEYHQRQTSQPLRGHRPSVHQSTLLKSYLAGEIQNAG